MALKRRGDTRRLRSGDLDHQVRIKRMSQTTDGQGGRIGTESTIATIWAKLEPLNASRSLAYGMTLNNRPYQVMVQYEEDAYTLDEDCWLELVASGQKLYIHSVINTDMRYRQMEILATEKR